MKLFISSTLIIATLFVCSCTNKNSKIIGSWKASFDDSIENPIQYLDFNKAQNKLIVSIDEPDEDWYSIPGEKLYFQKDSLHFERFWGLEKYDGNIHPGDSIIKGVKQVVSAKSDKISDEQKALIKEASADDYIYFQDIKAVGPDGNVRELSPVAFTIQK